MKIEGVNSHNQPKSCRHAPSHRFVDCTECGRSHFTCLHERIVQTVKPELCVCADSPKPHEHGCGPCGYISAEPMVESCRHDAPAKATEVMATVDGLPSGTVACMSVFGSTPVSQCQADWDATGRPWLRGGLSDQERVRLFSNAKPLLDLLDKKPNRPTEPLNHSPGSCTEGDNAHRGNVVCSSDESRQRIE